MSKHNHQVNETKKRSLAKTISFRIVEVIVDVIILYFLLISGLPELVIAGLGAIFIEAACGIGYYIWERIWNKVMWGREIVDQ